MCREYYHLHIGQNQYFLGFRKASQIQILNKSGPRIDPCGTPDNIISQELKEDSTLVLCLCLVRQEWINSNDLFSNSYALSLALSKLWSIQSNALERSVRTAPVSPPSSRVLHHFSTIVRRQCCTLKPFRNSHWNLENTESKYGKI